MEAQYIKQREDTSTAGTTYKLYVRNDLDVNLTNFLIEKSVTSSSITTITYYENTVSDISEIDTEWTDRASKTYSFKYNFGGFFFDGVGSGNSLWTKVGDDVYYSQGQVLIKTTTPDNSSYTALVVNGHLKFLANDQRIETRQIIGRDGNGLALRDNSAQSQNGIGIRNGGVLVGGDTPDGCAKLEVRSTTKGLLLPRMSTTQRDAIVSPVAGLLIFNITTNAPNYYNGTIWTAI